jgi:hypothetical protein
MPITELKSSRTDGTVSVQEVADKLAEDYFACEQNAIWLRECNSICSH